MRKFSLINLSSKLIQSNSTVFLSFLKRERFPPFVPMRYRVLARMFIGISGRSVLQPERSMSVFDRSGPFNGQKTLQNRKKHGI